MKSFTLLPISLSNLTASQNLAFTNNQETIIFKKNELINLNGQKYRYLRPLKNRTKIHLLKSSFIKKENIQFDIGKIETFRKYKRFKISNALRMAYFGFGTATILGALSGFNEGYNWNAGGDSLSRIEKIGVGTFFGLVGGFFKGIVYGLPSGLVYGFISLGENNLNYSIDYSLKFDNNKNSFGRH
tara:strand:+ start:49 stop:606 length:558 start_codon:yes stop_codon:yes gene_type:complete